MKFCFWNKTCYHYRKRTQKLNPMGRLLTIILFCSIATLSAQEKAYGDGEWFKFRIHYGLLTAGYASLEVNSENLNGLMSIKKKIYLIVLFEKYMKGGTLKTFKLTLITEVTRH
jgi:hypothetical protein